MLNPIGLFLNESDLNFNTFVTESEHRKLFVTYLY